MWLPACKYQHMMNGLLFCKCFELHYEKKRGVKIYVTFQNLTLLSDLFIQAFVSKSSGQSDFSSTVHPSTYTKQEYNGPRVVKFIAAITK